jgi:L-iditol 2-dehydrogenase
LPLDTNDFYFREIRLVPSYSCGPVETRAALDYVAAGVVRAEHVVTHRFPLADANQAYRAAAEDRSVVKAMVTFGGNPP